MVIGKLNKFNHRASACELLTSAYCNAECVYCYIPKVAEMKELHKDIIEHIKSGKYLESLAENYGDNLTVLSFWGTEPTLILDYITVDIEKYLERFSNLDTISFSSNFLTNTKSILELAYKLEDLLTHSNKTSFTLNVQISLDGPAFITDVSRKEGATKQIVKNYIDFIDKLAERPLKKVRIKSNFKPTFSVDAIKLFNSDSTYFKAYFGFFDELFRYFLSKEKLLRGCFIIQPSTSGTLMVPGRYTTSNGKQWALYLQNLYDFERYMVNNKEYLYHPYTLIEYELRLSNIIKSSVEYLSDSAKGTCSGGDSNFALDRKNKIHICHRSYYLNEEKYVESVLKNTDLNNWDVSTFSQSKVDYITKGYIADADNELDLARFQYIMRGFHDFTAMKESFIYLMLMSLVECGQASKIYAENHELAILLCMFLQGGFGCSIENAITMGSVHITSISLIRLWANGAFEVLVKNYLNREKVSSI